MIIEYIEKQDMEEKDEDFKIEVSSISRLKAKTKSTSFKLAVF